VIKHASGLEFEIVESDARRVKRIRVHTKKETPAEDDSAGADSG
jgi:CBS domain containing-hemolysin-like protein